MSISSLVDIVHNGFSEKWTDVNKEAFESLFGTSNGRYPEAARKTVTIRAPGMSSDTGVPFAAYIHPSNPTSGAYSGLSFVIFPIQGQMSLIGLVVGTQGLAPDDLILGRPGHARKAQAICQWLNTSFGNGQVVAWAKHDPTRTDVEIPKLNGWSDCKSVFDRYGKEIYAIYKPTGDRKVTELALTAFLDLLFEERGVEPFASYRNSAEKVRQSWFGHLLPRLDQKRVVSLLQHRRFVIVQGPPGTGKTYMAREILKNSYSGLGRTIQFHPNTTYESFIGGLAPAADTTASVGFHFAAQPGFLMQAATEALANPARNYLLHIDEINRADLGKILGEAIFLLEPTDPDRRIALSYDFGPPFHREFYLPTNLHILGTMNTSDRSIAILDVAVRRRFAFLNLMPQFHVVETACQTMRDKFQQLVDIFIEHAPEDAFNLMPGHSYFLINDESLAKESLRTSLAPLLEEYLSQGYVSGFAEPIRAFLQGIVSE